MTGLLLIAETYSLNRYIKHQASQDARKNAAAPFVLLFQDSKVVRAYYTLSMTSIELKDLPDDVARLLPKYPLVPATLLGRLAVDQICGGLGIGAFMLADALKRSLRNEIAWAVVVVDAIDEQAIGFYEHFGFIRMPMAQRLFLSRKTIEQSLLD